MGPPYRENFVFPCAMGANRQERVPPDLARYEKGPGCSTLSKKYV